MTASPGSLRALELHSLEGSSVSLGSLLLDRPALVVAVRYYGCLPCQHYLVALHDRRAEFAERDIDVIVVGVAADFQAQHLVERYGITFPMLLDPTQNLYKALELPRLRRADFLRPATWRVYAPLFVRRYLTRRADGPKQGRITGDPTQLPGLALVGSDVDVRWVHRGKALGDYPSIDDVLARIDQLGLSRA